MINAPATPSLPKQALAFAIVAATAVAAACLLPANASAGELSYDPTIGLVTYQAQPGETNDVYISDLGNRQGSFVSDTAGITLDDSISSRCVPSSESMGVDCEMLYVWKWVVNLGDMGDHYYDLVGNAYSKPDEVARVEVKAGDGDDQVYSGEFSNKATIWGGNGEDTLQSDSRVSDLFGEGDNDSLGGFIGSSDFDGGPGQDEFFLGLNGEANLTTGRVHSPGYPTNPSHPLDGKLTKIENLTGRGFSPGPTKLVGDAGPNRLESRSDGWYPPTTLIGAGGNDTVIGSGAGKDIVSYAEYSTGRVMVNQGSSAPQNTGGAGTDTLINIDDVTGTPFDNDIIWGDGNANTIDGLAGNDALIGCGGPDKLIGCTGNDSMADSYLICDGGVSNDTFVSDSGTDNVKGGNGYDTLDFSSRTQAIGTDLRGLAEGIEKINATNYNDTVITPNEALTIYGKNGNDKLSAGSKGAVFYGGDGKDVLTGSNTTDDLHGDGGDDTLYGLNGNDTYVGGDGWDTFSEKWGNIVTTGNDTFDAQDGLRDTIAHCGPVEGNDIVLRDPFDTIGPGC